MNVWFLTFIFLTLSFALHYSISAPTRFDSTKFRMKERCFATVIPPGWMCKTAIDIHIYYSAVCMRFIAIPFTIKTNIPPRNLLITFLWNLKCMLSIVWHKCLTLIFSKWHTNICKWFISYGNSSWIKTISKQ